MKRRLMGALAGFGLCAGLMVAAAPAASAVSTAIGAKPVMTVHVAHFSHFSLAHFRIPDLTQAKAYNWSGYADDNTTSLTYKSVSASWKEPAVTCNSSSDTEAVAFWVGLDGYTSSTVEQDGTIAECVDGSIGYFTWEEMYPTQSSIVVGNSISAGASIHASVTYNGSAYTLKLTVTGDSAANINTTLSCSSCTRTSAEWIAEAPGGDSNTSGIYPMPDFTSVHFSGAKVTSSSGAGVISTNPDDEITMVNYPAGTKTLAKPGKLTSAGNAFGVTWKAAS